MELQTRFEVVYLQEAADFLKTLPDKARAKVLYNIMVAQHENNAELFKKLNEDIWEFRTRFNGMSYRLFAFWDKGCSGNGNSDPWISQENPKDAVK